MARRVKFSYNFSFSMARREGVILLLDVGPLMQDVLPDMEKICSMLIEKKLLYRKNDEVGVVVFGTEETRNDLTEEVGGYANVVVLQTIKVVDGDLIEAVQELPRGTVNGDFLDAVVVGMDMLIKKYRETNKGKKRCCLITNALCPIKDPFEGTKEDQVSTIAVQMKKFGMKMESIVVRGKVANDADKSIMDENDRLLNIFAGKTGARTIYVEHPLSLRGALKTRKVLPVTVYRGDLDISPKMRIKIWVYKKTQEEKFPTLKKYSDKAPSTDQYATHEVKVDYEYKSIEDPNKIIPPEQRIKGYRYGPQVVPISNAEWDAFKFKPEKGVKLLGFANSSNIMRHYYMKDIYIFIPERGNTRAAVAISALARAMKRMNKVAILRCVWRQKQQKVVLGVLTPNISENKKTADSFYLNVLPFAEDIREFQFSSLSSFPASWQPQEEQQAAMDSFVKMLDLAPSDKEEVLRPEFTPNPVLERFYQHLELKSKDPDAPVPPLDETLKKIAEPDLDIISENKHVFDLLHRSFQLKENPRLKKSTRRLRDKPSASSDEDGDGDANVSYAQTVTSFGKGPKTEVERISDSTPIEDFNAMLSRRDNPEWITKAIKEMQNKILEMVGKSPEGQTGLEVVNLLLALRNGCIVEQEPKEFNLFLDKVCKLCQEKSLSNFYELLKSRGLTLVTKSEAPDSDVMEEEARFFLVKAEPRSELE